ncbi:MAG: hypothetical protein JO241_04210, partial [Candidatus Eremiobacteraeota bacterium]|nr:hypothetical protein [Candidatus Eremiobacteraeota bacterium]
MDDLELNVSHGETPIIDAGARVPLWIRAYNHGAALARELRIEVTAAASLLLVSNNVWLRSQPAGEKLAFALPALLHDECCELIVDAYAVRAGDARCVVRLDVDGDLRDMEVAGEVRAWPAFGESANRFEIPVREAEAGAGVDGYAIVTNTGFGHALVSKIAIDGDLDCTFNPEPFELAPGERRVLAVAARVPAAAADGTVLRARATCALASGEAVVLGDATVRARSRPRIEGRIDCTSERDVDAGDRVGWALHVENTGGAIADAVRIAVRLA